MRMASGCCVFLVPNNYYIPTYLPKLNDGVWLIVLSTWEWQFWFKRLILLHNFFILNVSKINHGCGRNFLLCWYGFVLVDFFLSLDKHVIWISCIVSNCYVLWQYPIMSNSLTLFCWSKLQLKSELFHCILSKSRQFYILRNKDKPPKISQIFFINYVSHFR